MRTLLVFACLIAAVAGRAADAPKSASDSAALADQESKGMDWLRRNFPETYETFQELEARYPAEFRAHFDNMLSSFQSADDPKERDRRVEAVRLRFQLHDLSDQYRDEKDGKKRLALKAKMKDALNRLFDVQLESQQVQLKRLEKETDQLKRKVDKSRRDKTQIVDRRLDQLTGQGDDFEW